MCGFVHNNYKCGLSKQTILICFLMKNYITIEYSQLQSFLSLDILIRIYKKQNKILFLSTVSI